MLAAVLNEGKFRVKDAQNVRKNPELHEGHVGRVHTRAEARTTQMDGEQSTRRSVTSAWPDQRTVFYGDRMSLNRSEFQYILFDRAVFVKAEPATRAGVVDLFDHSEHSSVSGIKRPSPSRTS